MRVSPFLLIGLFASAAPVWAQTPDVPALPKSFNLDEVDSYVAGQVKTKGFVGLSMAVMKDGEVVFAKGYGKSSLKSGQNVTPQTLFGAGSVTKQLTSACVLLLAEEGKLSVNDKVAKYYPDLTRAKEITLYDLMTHVSGYPDYYPLDFVDRRMAKPIDPDKLIAEYASGKLDFEPGTRWSYSNTGYIILGRVVERVSGRPFAQFLEERILKPAGMVDSVYEPKPEHKGLATGYTSFMLGEPSAAIPEADGWVLAAGGLFTTPTDLARWDLALMKGKLLKPASIDLMTKPRVLADGRTKNYGCGLFVVPANGEIVLRHGGAVSGFLANNSLMPRTKSAFVMMTNGDHVDAGALYLELLTLFLRSQDLETPAVPKVKGPPAKVAALSLFHQMQSGEIDRDKLGEEFNHFLSEERVQEAKQRLKALGEPDRLEIEDTHERGGMEVVVIRFYFKNAKMKGSLYRTPDGKIQQFLLYRS